MAHKNLIGGTAYDTKGGKCLVNGTSYEVKKGRTLVSGTGYDVKFEGEKVPVWGDLLSSGVTDANGKYFNANSLERSSDGAWLVPLGTVLRFRIESPRWPSDGYYYSGGLFVDGTSRTSTSSDYSYVYFNLEVTGPMSVFRSYTAEEYNDGEVSYYDYWVVRSITKPAIITLIGYNSNYSNYRWGSAKPAMWTNLNVSNLGSMPYPAYGNHSTVAVFNEGDQIDLYAPGTSSWYKGTITIDGTQVASGANVTYTWAAKSAVINVTGSSNKGDVAVYTTVPDSSYQYIFLSNPNGISGLLGGATLGGQSSGYDYWGYESGPYTNNGYCISMSSMYSDPDRGGDSEYAMSGWFNIRIPCSGYSKLVVVAQGSNLATIGWGTNYTYNGGYTESATMNGLTKYSWDISGKSEVALKVYDENTSMKIWSIHLEK